MKRQRGERLPRARAQPWCVACAASALVILGGCGQKGPLYLPDQKGSVVKPAATSDAARPPEKIDPEQKDDSQKPPTP
jgi:predicted small lipoprotein YifL